MIDVAARAGVSMKTVSNVVNGTGSASAATRARVQAAVDALGYRPNVTARRLASGQTRTISVAVSSITVSYFAEISQLLDRASRLNRLRVVIEQTEGDRANELAILDERERGLVDGVVFHPVSLTPADLAERTPGFPLVLLGEGPAPSAVDHVMIDNESAARDVTEHLITAGCRRIAFLGREHEGPTHTTGLRLSGYRDALRTHALGPDVSLELAVHHYSADEGYRAVTAALDRGTTFDGIVCRDDVLAAGALHALHDRGVRVPEDVAVTGWDDLTMSRHLWPPLTTVQPAKSDIAETALRLLMDRIGGCTGPGRHELVPARLVPRRSTAR